MPEPSFTVAELKVALDIGDPDPDAATIRQIAEMLGCCDQTARNYVSRAVEAGTMRESTVKVPDRRGYLRTVPGYVIVKLQP